MSFNGFPREGIELLLDIELNNNKEWFEANRDRHERYIVAPCKAYIEEIGEHLQILVPTIHAIPKTNRSLFKIYRDSRLHPTEPIKTKIGIICWQGGGHRMQSSSFYMHYDSEGVFFATGIRNFKSPLLKVYREYIADKSRREELHSILTELEEMGYKIPEPKYKRYPKGFDSSMPYAYLSRFGAVYAYSTMRLNATFHSRGVIKKSMSIYSDMFRLQQWVYELTLYGESQSSIDDM